MAESQVSIESLALRYDGRDLWVIDQTKLPQEKSWLNVTAPADLVQAICDLKVRGAPMIGVSAVICLANYGRWGANENDFLKAAAQLRASRPTAVNLMNNIDELLSYQNRQEKYDPKALVESALGIFREDIELCHRIAKNGADLIEPGDGLLTHCNTGGLATAGVGTAIGILREAARRGHQNHVYVDETRPLLQGGRLTAWELGELKIPYTLICDNMAAILMKQGRVQKIFVGCDRIARNGDFANKVGTYGLAVLARYHNVPFYVAGPRTTVDLSCASGAEIPIEERGSAEVRGARGSFGAVEWAPLNAPVYNPSFDVTPAELVSGWILDSGVYTKPIDMVMSLQKG
jgi:methylthioribose-1-phosphate isomerase